MLKLKARRDFPAGRFFKKSMGAEKSMGDPSTEGKSRERLWGQVLKYKKLTFQDLTPATLYFIFLILIISETFTPQLPVAGAPDKTKEGSLTIYH
jgi:hypothetical protein